jgi:hypothetical protein
MMLNSFSHSSRKNSILHRLAKCTFSHSFAHIAELAFSCDADLVPASFVSEFVNSGQQFLANFSGLSFKKSKVTNQFRRTFAALQDTQRPNAVSLAVKFFSDARHNHRDGNSKMDMTMRFGKSLISLEDFQSFFVRSFIAAKCVLHKEDSTYSSNREIAIAFLYAFFFTPLSLQYLQKGSNPPNALSLVTKVFDSRAKEVVSWILLSICELTVFFSFFGYLSEALLQENPRWSWYDSLNEAVWPMLWWTLTSLIFANLYAVRETSTFSTWKLLEICRLRLSAEVWICANPDHNDALQMLHVKGSDPVLNAILEIDDEDKQKKLHSKVSSPKNVDGWVPLSDVNEKDVQSYLHVNILQKEMSCHDVVSKIGMSSMIDRQTRPKGFVGYLYKIWFPLFILSCCSLLMKSYSCYLLPDQNICTSSSGAGLSTFFLNGRLGKAISISYLYSSTLTLMVLFMVIFNTVRVFKLEEIRASRFSAINDMSKAFSHNLPYVPLNNRRVIRTIYFASNIYLQNVRRWSTMFLFLKV